MQMQVPPPQTPTPPAPPEPTLEDVQKLESSQRLAMVLELQRKVAQGVLLSPEESRLGIRLIAAERMYRAGGKGGSKAKATAAKESFTLNSVDEL